MSGCSRLLSGALPDDATGLMMEFLADQPERDLARVASTNVWMSQLPGRFRQRIYEELQLLGHTLYPSIEELPLHDAFLKECECLREGKGEGTERKLGLIFKKLFATVVEGQNLVKHAQASPFLRRSLVYYFEHLLKDSPKQVDAIHALWIPLRTLVKDPQQRADFDFRLGIAYYEHAWHTFDEFRWDAHIDEAPAAEIAEHLIAACALFADFKEFDPEHTPADMLPKMLAMFMNMDNFEYALAVVLSTKDREQLKWMGQHISSLSRIYYLNDDPDTAIEVANKIVDAEAKEEALGEIGHYFLEQGNIRRALKMVGEQGKCGLEWDELSKATQALIEAIQVNTSREEIREIVFSDPILAEDLVHTGLFVAVLGR